MAIKPAKGNYLTLEDVRVTYDKKTDTIHLTSKDKDIPKSRGGFHIALNSGRTAENILREMLDNADMLSERVSEKIPSFISYDKANLDLSWNQFPLGVGSAGNEIVWDVKSAPHMLLTGRAGMGKSIVEYGLINHCIKNSDKWRFLGIDISGVTLSGYEKENSTVMGIGNTLEEGLQVLRYVHNEIFNNRRAENCNIETEPALLVMIDDAALIFGQTGIKTDVEKEKDALRGEAQVLLSEMIQCAGAVNVHFVICSQRPDSSIIYGQLKNNLTARFAVGNVDQLLSYMVFGHDKAMSKKRNPGRGYFQTFAEGQEIQVYFIPKNQIV